MDKTQDTVQEDSKGSSAVCIKERTLLPTVAVLHGKCKPRETLHVRYVIMNISFLPDNFESSFAL